MSTGRLRAAKDLTQTVDFKINDNINVIFVIHKDVYIIYLVL